MPDRIHPQEPPDLGPVSPEPRSMSLTSPSEPSDVVTRRWARIANRITVTLIFMVILTSITLYVVAKLDQRLNDIRLTQRTLNHQQHELKITQQAGIIRGLKNRAVECENSELLGVRFDTGDPCLAKELRPYFVPSQTRQGP